MMTAFETVKAALIVGVGSFVGGAGRYLVGEALKHAGKGFPWGTLLVNLAGCLLIGLLWGWLDRAPGAGDARRLFLVAGFCGGFTTFSSFSKESLAMLQGGNATGFIAYLLCSVVAGLLLTALGHHLTR